MPAMLDDPASPTIYRVSGEPPYPDPSTPALPPDIIPRQVTLRDRQTVATIVPFASRHQVPLSLHTYLCDQLNKEIEGGDTYPMMDLFETDKFASYWFQNFGAVMMLGNIESPDEVLDGERDWAKECLGAFYIKPNYPGRSSHVCNAGFLVTDAARNRGVGRLMGEAYIDWAPRIGYTYSVFNLVYETNVASCKIWDALGFKRIGRVKGCGNLKSYPDRLIDAIIYGRDLAPGDSDDLVSEERFDKIKYYLKFGKYPNGADRAEKSRLRSAATHYKLLDDDKLMLKDKEVISDPAHQYDIARVVHVQQHGGINKTTATIAEKYHWSRIKETVSDVIRNCVECKEMGKTPNPGGVRKAVSVSAPATTGGSGTAGAAQGQVDVESMDEDSVLALHTHDMISTLPNEGYANPSDIVMPPSHTLRSSPHDQHDLSSLPSHHVEPRQHGMYVNAPSHIHTHNQNHHNSDTNTDVYQPIDPQMINNTQHSSSHEDQDIPFDNYADSHADFQALLNATTEDDHVDILDSSHADAAGQDGEEERRQREKDAVDRDLEMLIDHHDDDDDVDVDVDGMDVPNHVDSDSGAGDQKSEAKEKKMYDVDFGASGAFRQGD